MLARTVGVSSELSKSNGPIWRAKRMPCTRWVSVSSTSRASSSATSPPVTDDRRRGAPGGTHWAVMRVLASSGLSTCLTWTSQVARYFSKPGSSRTKACFSFQPSATALPNLPTHSRFLSSGQANAPRWAAVHLWPRNSGRRIMARVKSLKSTLILSVTVALPTFGSGPTGSYCRSNLWPARMYRAFSLNDPEDRGHGHARDWGSGAGRQGPSHCGVPRLRLQPDQLLVRRARRRSPRPSRRVPGGPPAGVKVDGPARARRPSSSSMVAAAGLVTPLPRRPPPPPRGRGRGPLAPPRLPCRPTPPWSASRTPRPAPGSACPWRRRARCPTGSASCSTTPGPPIVG